MAMLLFYRSKNDSCTQRNSQKGVFKQMDATFINYFTHTHTRVRIHSFFLTLNRGLTIKYSSILKVMGMYTMSVSRKYLLYGICKCIDLKVQLITAVSAVLSQVIY